MKPASCVFHLTAGSVLLLACHHHRVDSSIQKLYFSFPFRQNSALNCCFHYPCQLATESQQAGFIPANTMILLSLRRTDPIVRYQSRPVGVQNVSIPGKCNQIICEKRFNIYSHCIVDRSGYKLEAIDLNG